MSRIPPPAEDGPIPFFGGPPTSANPNQRAGPPPRPLQQQQRAPFPQQQQHQNHQSHQQQQQQQHHQQSPFMNQARPPIQAQLPQRHPQQHHHQMPPQQLQQQQHQQQPYQPQSQQQQQGVQRQPPVRQMSASPFAPAADLFASPPSSNLSNRSQSVSAPPQGFQPQGGFPLSQGPPLATATATAAAAPPKAIHQGQQQHQHQHQQQAQIAPPRFPPQQHSPIQQKVQPPPVVAAAPVPVVAAPSVQIPSPAPAVKTMPAAALPPPPQAKQQQGPPSRRPSVQQQQQQQQQQQHQPGPFQRNPQHHNIQQQTPFVGAQHQPVAHPPVQEIATSSATLAASAVPAPVRERSNSSFGSASDLFGNASHQAVSGWGIPASVASEDTLSFAAAPVAAGPPKNIGRPPLPPSTSSYQGPPQPSPLVRAAAAPPKTPILTEIQTPLMLPAQTQQMYQSSRTPYMGPIRNQFGSSSQLLLEPCPFAECGGENKPQAKFCSECGRSIFTASRSATPSLGHYAEFPNTTPTGAPPMPSLDRMNSYSQDGHYQQPEQIQGTEPFAYGEGDQSYQQDQLQQQSGYNQDQQVYNEGYGQSYDANYDPNYQQGYDQGYDQSGYYDQSQQYYDPATGQYLDYAHQEQVVPEPEPEPVEPEPVGIVDPLNRIQGCPLIAFGFGGKIMTSFPRTVQRFASTSSDMMTKRYPGDLQLQHLKDVLTIETSLSTYPGPLLMDSAVQMKTKRKDVLKLIEDKIHSLDNHHNMSEDSAFDAHPILVWKLFKVMFEQEGALVGGPKVDEAVRSVLLSIPLSVYPVQPAQHPPSPIGSSASMDVLQDLLRNGDRTGAVRYAMSSNLWAHALVISSCVNKELWKEAVNGFVNQELTSGGGDIQANGREALRVLYALFSGQTQNAISELIPSSLRTNVDPSMNDTQPTDDQFVTAASLAMMKPVEEPKIPGSSLGQWRETLAMILSNRTSGDQTAISSLGDLLMKEGWVEAAHICYLLSPQNSVHSGPDAQLNRLVLIGADANPNSAYPYHKNLEAFRKTEIYEFASALRSSGATGGLPFLQAYKLFYVWTLVEWGMFSEAGRYLESVEAIVKSQTKGSPYYNAVFLDRLKDITDRLTGSSQLIVTEGSWFNKKVPKPTIGGIFDALDNKISKFIAGDNEQAKPPVTEPKASVETGGPFANAPALPDLSHLSARAPSNVGHQAAASNSRRTSVNQQVEAPVVDYNAAGHYNQGYDQSGQYSAEAYTQGDLNNAATGYGYDAQAAYGYDAAGGQQAYGEEQTYGADQTHGEEQYSEQQPLDQSAFEGAYDYNGQYASEYDPSQQQQQYGETVDALAIQPDVVPPVSSTDSGLYSTQAVHGSEKQLSVDDSHHHHEHAVEHAAVEPVAEYSEATAQYGEYSADALAASGEYAYTEGATYEGGEYQQSDFQQGEYTQGEYQGEYQQEEYQQEEYQQGEYQQGEYQQGEYQQGEYQQGEYQQGEYQQGEYQQGDHQQGDYQQGEYQQGEYQQGGDYQSYDQSHTQTLEPAAPVEDVKESAEGQAVSTEYNDQPLYDASVPHEQASEHQTYEHHAAEQVLADEPTFEQQYNETAAATATAEDDKPVAPVESAEAQYGEYAEGDYQQGGDIQYQEGTYAEGDYQQSGYAQDYQQQGEYQTEYQQGEYQGEYQQDQYVEGTYQEGDYQQGHYTEGDYQQTEYQQGDYQQGEYQQEQYQQGGHQQGEYQEGDYQQQQPHAEDHVQPAGQDEPGVLPVQDATEYDASTANGDYNANSGWWGGGADPNAAPSALADGHQQTDQPEEDYEEGQFISFGAVPTIPFGQPALSAAPVNNNSNNNNQTFEEEDDLGWGNSSLKKKVTPEDANANASASAADNGSSGAAAGSDSAQGGANGDGSDESKAGWGVWGKIAIFGGEKREPTPKPSKANLGEESSFYFDKEQQRWINGKEGADAAAAPAPLAPPPMGSRTTTPAVPSPVASAATVGPPAGRAGGPPSSGGPASAGLPSGPPRPAGATGTAARRGARSRYVDVLNTN